MPDAGTSSKGVRYSPRLPTMTNDPLIKGFLVPLSDLTIPQLADACEAAFQNAKDLLEEAELLRGAGRHARGYFLAHIACEELGKLPILLAVAASLAHAFPVEWKKIDRALRDHGGKVRQVLFMDSLFGNATVGEGAQKYAEDVAQMRGYLDLKNSSLYSFQLDGKFLILQNEITREFLDSFLGLAHSRLRAFDQMYMRPVRAVGGLEAMMTRHKDRVDQLIGRLTGPEGHAVFEQQKATGDESLVEEFLLQLLGLTADQLDVVPFPEIEDS